MATKATFRTVPVETSDLGQATTPIGLNQPLRIEIKDVFTGDHDAGEVLLSTAVKSATTFDAQPLALQATHTLRPEQPQHLPFRASESGSSIVFYTPAVLDRELIVDVRMDFDRYDRDRYDRYITLLSQSATLPVFVGAAVLGGPAAVGATSAAVYAAASGLKVVNRAIDRWSDSHNRADLLSTFAINLETPGELPTKAGYFLCWDDEQDPLVSASGTWDGGDTVVAGERGEEFTVDGNGKLLYRDSGRRVDDLAQGYVLLHISGAADRRLANFAPTAASAALVARFIGGDSDFVGDLAELAQAYNDFYFLRRVGTLDRELAAASDERTTETLKAERAAVVKHIRSEALVDLLSESPVGPSG